ncbi:unnamed protein product [Lota lota]
MMDSPFCNFSLQGSGAVQGSAGGSGTSITYMFSLLVNTGSLESTGYTSGDRGVIEGRSAPELSLVQVVEPRVPPLMSWELLLVLEHEELPWDRSVASTSWVNSSSGRNRPRQPCLKQLHRIRHHTDLDRVQGVSAWKSRPALQESERINSPGESLTADPTQAGRKSNVISPPEFPAGRTVYRRDRAGARLADVTSLPKFDGTR